MIYLISPFKKQYKANLHSHSTLSDGHKNPQELKELYRANGYSILAITDHEFPASHQELTEKDFLMITGYEAYIRINEKAEYRVYDKEIHLNLFAQDPMNRKFICFNENYGRYIRQNHAMDSLERVGSEHPRRYSREYINEYIRTANENGYLVAYNHPYWSMEDEADILAYEGLFSLEISNYNSYNSNHLEHSGALYDKMLRANRRIFCHAGDDNHNAYPIDHPNSDSFGAFTMIYPGELTYGAVIEAMEHGEMYASMGPVFHEISLDGDRLHVECSEVSHIMVYTGSKTPRYLNAAPGEDLTVADLTIDGQARYVRVSLVDRFGRWADTRGFFPEELGL